MKKGILLAVAFIWSISSFAQEYKEPKVDASPLDMSYYRVQNGDETKNYARIIYSRPQVKGRKIFGELVPYGKMWRTGANEATEIQFYEDVTIAGTEIEAGPYEIFTVPGEKRWSIILSTYQNSWGAYRFKDDDTIMKFTVPAIKSSVKFEYFSIYFMPKAKEGEVDMVMAWDDTIIRVPMSFNAE
jgi:hypothetical protein